MLPNFQKVWVMGGANDSLKNLWRETKKGGREKIQKS